ncbi:hypothetical protein TrVE_jg13310 [Triparma verrucosa]|uniref:SAM-dependent MTase RsmB/NOP-type domain-containing protein n=1 Tax=Triparma verrucosa TaxID=1606542 RepID=A0A9W7F9S9_9STRA|nr:hypothetical protein TrVE_jg13310 [Triparma verrucosa]
MDPSVQKHYASAGLDRQDVTNYLDNATASRWRFVRLNPRHPNDATLKALEAEIGSTPVRVPWLPECAQFFAIPSATALNNLRTYQEGKIYGMDCSSGAAVAALGLNVQGNGGEGRTVRVLDLCCCPGAKLCMIVDMLLGSRMEVVGVDISDARLNICKKLLRKYVVTDVVSESSEAPSPLVRLFHADGTTFPQRSDCLVFDSRAEAQETASSKGRKRMNKSARAREKKRLKQLKPGEGGDEAGDKAGGTKESPAEYDYVLVDAECSTDGALTHLKHKKKGLKGGAGGGGEGGTVTATVKRKLDDEENLTALQLSLLNSGFANLKVGGTIVYATCSLSAKQNEDVVRAFIDQHGGEAEAVPLDFLGGNKSPAVSGPNHSLRFSPTLTAEVGVDSVISGGGFFLCKIVRRKVVLK